MALALLADLHSNLEALTQVLEDIRARGIGEIHCLGDLVGYGPDPLPVVRKAMEWKTVLMGNHDEAVLKEAYGFNPVARAAVAWTRDRLRPGFFSGRQKRECWKFLSGLKLTHQLDGALLVHGSPRDPTMEYVLPSDCENLAGGVPEKIRDIFSRFERICFVGHTHEPGFINDDAKYVSPRECNGELVFEPGRKYLVNVGSVGQPRDGDPRACYVVYSTGRVVWRRVEYDCRVTMRKMLDVPQLDRRAAERLAEGR